MSFLKKVKSHALRVLQTMLALTAGILFAPAAFAQTSQGQSIGTIATNLASSFSSVGTAVQTFCWVMSFVIGAASAFKFAAYAKDQDREKISTPFLLLFVAALFFAIPMVLSTGAASVWGNSTTITQSAH